MFNMTVLNNRLGNVRTAMWAKSKNAPAWLKTKGISLGKMVLAMFKWVFSHLDLFFWLGVVLFVIFAGFYLVNYFSTPNPPAPIINPSPQQIAQAAAQSTAPSGGWFFWRFLAVMESILAAIVFFKKDNQSKKLSLYFLAASVGSCIVVAGKLDGLFAWIVAGLPILSTLSFYGYREAPEKSRVKSFLGFTLGFTILAWMYLFVQAMINPDLSFLGDRLTDPTNKIIGCLFFVLFTFGLGAKNIIIRFVFCSLGLIVLISWLGTDVIDRIQVRYPKQLTLPPVSQKIKDAGEKVLDNTLDIITGEKVKADAAAAAKAKLAADEAARKQRLEELRIQSEIQKKNQSSIAPQATNRSITIQIKKDGQTPYWDELSAGTYTIEPRRAQFVRDGENYISDSNGFLSLNRKTKVNFYLPGAEIGPITITKIN